MSKSNALAGLIGNYGDSDDESDDGSKVVPNSAYNAPGYAMGTNPSVIQPAPIQHCLWSACYDETSGFTYYWNQQTNAVTWEAPPEYLLALKLAQQQLYASGSAEVSAAEWQLYQQALAEKQKTKVISKPPAPSKNTVKKHEKPSAANSKSVKSGKKRSRSDDEDEKIELITSYHNSDSESNDEPDSPVKAVKQPKQPQPAPKTPKSSHKKAKTKTFEYGPSLPANQNYTVPIGPEMPPELVKPKPSYSKESNGVVEDKKTSKVDSDDENTLLKRLKDKAKLLEKLGGELPSGLEKIIGEESGSGTASPAKTIDEIKPSDIDDLLEEIEKKELPKAKNKRIDIFDEDSKCSVDSIKNSPISGIATPETKPLFPSANNIENTESLPSVSSKEVERESKESQLVSEKKGTNLYLPDPNEQIEKTNRKKLRISNSVLPERKAEMPSYTTKYSEHIDGFSGERTGLGFSQNESEMREETVDNTKNVITYGNGLMFTKGETLKADKDDDEAEDLDLIEAKLKHLLELQPVELTPIQKMLLQLETLVVGRRAGGVSAWYWLRAARGLRRLENGAAPPGWAARFHRSEGRYKYVRESDNFEQWEYPVGHTDMDISTTPPHQDEPCSFPSPSPAPCTPPPPPWQDPPPPGCDEPPPPLHTYAHVVEPKQEIGNELLSFYNDIAELEKHSSDPNTATNSPERTHPDIVGTPVRHNAERDEKERDRERERERERDRERERVTKKKTKLKVSSSIGMKHKSVSNMVAKWQQVADEINSD